MRRLLLTAFALAAVGCGLLLSSGTSTGQLIQAIVADTRHGGGGNFTTNCTESGNFLNTKVGGQGMGMSTTIAAYYDTMICGMVTDGTWAILDTLYIEAAPTTAIAKMNLTSTATTYDLVSHGTGTFTANSDYTGNGSSGYLDTQFVPSTAGGHYTSTSASGGSYVLNNVSVGDIMSLGSQSSGNKIIALKPNFAVGAGAIIQVNDSTNYEANAGTAVTSGCLVGANDGANVYIYNVWSGGGPYGNSQATSAPDIPNFSVYLEAMNTSGTPGGFANFKLGAAFIGGYMTLTQRGNMCTRINAFMTSQGVNAY
jgi:hypothetical protein